MLKIAHRGASGYEPENTLRAFKKALEMNSDVIELDVRLTKDFRLVVFHDNKIKRITRRKGKIKYLTLKQLRNYDIGKGEKIPTLEQVLNLTKRKVKVNIELKGKNTVEPTLKIIERYVYQKGWKYSDFLISSFNCARLKKVSSLNPQLRLGVLFNRKPLRYLKKAIELRAYSINPGYKSLSKKLVKKAHEHNMKVFVWTVNKKRKILRANKMSVDGIITNFIDRIP